MQSNVALVDDLAMLVKQLVRELRTAAPGHALPEKAMDYLNRNGLAGSPLRAASNDLPPVDLSCPACGTRDRNEHAKGCAVEALIINLRSQH